MEPDAKRFCDIVMEGGITSGVVYPLAAVKLAERYTFKNVGGTSAGAIASAGVAAAQYGKSRGRGTEFRELAELPDWLGSNLSSLFQPSRAARPLFAILEAATTQKTGRWKLAGTISAIIRGFPLASVAGALPAALLAGAVLAEDGAFMTGAGLLCAALLLALGLGAAIAFAFARRLSRALAQNGYGLVVGSTEDDRGPPALTPWLADLLDRLAGKEGKDALTFGDLWGPDPGERAINLEMMTTCVTQARPYRLPFEVDEFWFWPDQLRGYFPDRIVDQMVRGARDDARKDDFAPLVPLPRAADLPVVVATRMSLSFPLLISAVPLYAIDHSMAIEGEDRHPEPCWFSDGGIASNFPIHFFDSPVPRWPTFAIDLRKVPHDWDVAGADQRENVWMVQSNDSSGDVWWNGWDKLPKPRSRVLGFLAAVAKTMYTWMDTEQSHTQGYRDRIVHIDHTKKEGGLNLRMSKDTIRRLSERGGHAGDLLLERFASPEGDGTAMTWDNQRWIRYRSYMRLLEKNLVGVRTGCTGQLAPDPSVEELSRRGPHVPPEFHWLSEGQRDFALTGTAELLRLIERWQKSGESFAPGAPEPPPELRVAPRI